MENFDKAIDIIFYKNEGVTSISSGFNQYPHTRKKNSKFGLTQDMIKTIGFSIPIKDITTDIAKNVYKVLFWDKNYLGDIKSLEIATIMLDICVHLGNKALKDIVNDFIFLIKDNGKKYKKFNNDSNLSLMDIITINEEISSTKDIITLIRIIKDFSFIKYINIIKNNPSLKKEMFNWLSRKF